MESDDVVTLVSQQPLRHGNRPGDPSTSPRCGARTRSGLPCRAPAMWSGKKGKYTRCRMHGGASTGPRTEEGLKRCREASLKHGDYSAETKARRRAWRFELLLMRLEFRQLEREIKAYLREKRRRERAMPIVVSPLEALTTLIKSLDTT